MLRVEHLSKSFDGPPSANGQPPARLDVLRDVSLTLKPGDSASIVGASGSGKSTLLYICGGLDRPTAGTVTLGDINPHTLDAKALAAFRNRRVGFVFQDHCLLPQCSVLENVLTPTIVTGTTKDDIDRARTLLDRVGLSKRLDHQPAELSGGEKQRVAIARALVRQPALLLCDEPTGNLDRETAESVTALLLELHAQLQTIPVDRHAQPRAGRALRPAVPARRREARRVDADGARPARPALLLAHQPGRRRRRRDRGVGAGRRAGRRRVGEGEPARAGGVAARQRRPPGRVDRLLPRGAGSRRVAGREPRVQAAGFIALDGLAADGTNTRRAANVAIYGVDDAFFAFHGVPAPAGDEGAFGGRQALVSPALARDLGVAAGDSVLARLPSPSIVPSATLHGRRDALGKTMRATRARRAAGVRPRRLLAAAAARARCARSSCRWRACSASSSGPTASTRSWSPATSGDRPRRDGPRVTLADAGLSLRSPASGRRVSLESDSGIISPRAAAAARRTIAPPEPSTPVFAYLAHTLRVGAREIPYAVVAGVELDRARSRRCAAPPDRSRTTRSG